MKYLIVGLGNIGPAYELTRHNIGFLVLDRLAEQQKITFNSSGLAFQADFKFKSRQIYLIKPTTFMNLSGKAVNYWMKDLKIAKENVLVITDDIALPYEKMRMRAKGSAAGHNGLKSVEEHLGGNDYARLKFGISDNFHKGQQVDYVLSNFTPNELAVLPTLMDKAGEMILSFCTVGIERTMNLFND